MSMRKILVSAVAAVMVAGGVSLAVAPTASAFSCPSVGPDNIVTPAPVPPIEWPRCDLSGANLSGANLTSADLRDVDLTGANLSGAQLSGANLSGAQLPGANLSGAQLSGTNLSGANLSGANLTSANLTSANLSCLGLSCVDLFRADLSGANLTSANLTSANLTFARLAGANLTGATLTSATLTGLNLANANLTSATLTGASLDGANLPNANLRSARVTCSDTGVLGTGITGAPSALSAGWTLTAGTLRVPIVPCPPPNRRVLVGEDAEATSCPSVDQVTGVVTPRLGPGLNYRGCSFVGANLDGVDLTGAQLGSTQWGQTSAVQAVLTGADLSEAVFLGPVNLTRATLTGADLDKADLAEGFVTAAGDTGELGCAITGRPRTLPTRWALANGCLKTKGASPDQAPRPCRAVTVDAVTAPIPFTAGPHALWAEGDLSCTEATDLIESATEDGTVNSRFLARRMVQALAQGESGELSVALSSTQSLTVTAEPIGTDSGSQQRLARTMRVEVTYRQADDTGASQRITHSWDWLYDRDNCRVWDVRNGVCVG